MGVSPWPLAGRLDQTGCSGHASRPRTKLHPFMDDGSSTGRNRMRIVHLTASTFFGGPERQMLGLARHLPADCQTHFLSFSEGDRCREFLKHVRWNGFASDALTHDTPNLPAAALELTRRLGEL